MVIVTTCVAILLGIVIRYPPPTDPSWYWSVLLLCWVLGPMITACAVRSILSESHVRVSFGLLAIAMSVIGVAGLSAAELLLINPSMNAGQTTVRLVASFYGRLIFGYVLSFTVFAVAARVQGAPQPRAVLDS